jgi:hypothetical protein
MGSSGVGQAIKTGLTAYGMQQSGLTDWLNNLNKKPEGQTVVQGSVPLPDSFNKYLSTASPEPSSMAGAVNPNAAAFTQQAQNQVNLNQSMIPAPSIGGAPTAIAPAPGVEVTPVPEFPSDAGHKLLDGDEDWLNPQASRDSLVLAPQQTMEAPRLTGNEYQQVPGYGSLKKAAAMMAGMG